MARRETAWVATYLKDISFHGRSSVSRKEINKSILEQLESFRDVSWDKFEMIVVV